MESVRPAEGSDLGLCADLVQRALTGAQSMRGGPALIGTMGAQDLMQRWTAPEAALYVGEIDGVVVGLAAVTAATAPATTSADATPRSGRVECCYVEEEARGVGVGTALMEAAVDWCRQHGCHDIDALALPGDRSMKQRFEAAGFTARLLTLNRRLD